MVVVLFLVNLLAVQREHAAKAAATASLQLADATNEVRFQMMQNRLYLSNYLLSGDTREVDRMNEGLRTLAEKLQNRASRWRIPSRSARRWTRWSSWSRPGARNSPSP
jgi:hypothetical protein